MDPGIAKHVGAGLLAEVEEESLEMLLASLQQQQQQQQQQANLSTSETVTDDHSSSAHAGNSSSNSTIHPKLLALPPGLRDLVVRHQKATTTASSSTAQQQQHQQTPVLSITGRYLPLLYHLVSTLIAAPHLYAVVVIDPEWRFDVTRLLLSSSPSSPTITTTTNPSYPATPSDLRHVHILRPPRTATTTTEGDSRGGGLRAALAAAREWMLYAPAPRHPSRDREWWGTVVVGGGDVGLGPGPGPGGGEMLVTSGWKGWLRVDREEVAGFAEAGSCSVEEALAQRGRRGEAVERARWVAACRWGGYAWRE
ncbi:hypothetical protein SLS62_009022 [Diatrype stigma]|uniref:Uncharacterized protein n=1 Tax=Diatrype stigma TaxID=117547 RepID=A0AAN9UGX3_9PEZI